MDTDETASAVATATPEPEPDPEVVAAERRHAGYREVVAWPERMLQVTTLAEVHTDMDIPVFGPSWMLSERQVERALGPDATDEAKRAFALTWLRRHADGLRSVLRLMGEPTTLRKVSRDGRFGVAAHIGVLTVDVLVADALTCTLEPTGEVEQVPAQEATTRPVMRKVCPPSIYADVADDIADPEPEPEPEPDQPTPTDTDPEAF